MLILYFENLAFSDITSWSARVSIVLVIGRSGRVGRKLGGFGRVRSQKKDP